MRRQVLAVQGRQCWRRLPRRPGGRHLHREGDVVAGRLGRDLGRACARRLALQEADLRFRAIRWRTLVVKVDVGLAALA